MLFIFSHGPVKKQETNTPVNAPANTSVARHATLPQVNAAGHVTNKANQPSNNVVHTLKAAGRTILLPDRPQGNPEEVLSLEKSRNLALKELTKNSKLDV